MDARFVPGSDTNRMVQNNSAHPFNEASAQRHATNTRPMMVDGENAVGSTPDGHETVLGKGNVVPSKSADAFGVVASHNADIVSRAGGRIVRG